MEADPNFTGFLNKAQLQVLFKNGATNKKADSYKQLEAVFKCFEPILVGGADNIDELEFMTTLVFLSVSDFKTKLQMVINKL